MYQNNPQPPQEELEEEVFDTEKGLPLGDDDAPSQPDGDGEWPPEVWEDVSWLAQENMGTRREISVLEDAVLIDNTPLALKELSAALQESYALFGPFTLAVDEYKKGSKKMFAISQAIAWKGVDLARTVTSVRLSAVREIYGFLVNKGQEDRVIALDTVRTKKEKEALDNPRFFHSNRGYDAP